MLQKLSNLNERQLIHLFWMVMLCVCVCSLLSLPNFDVSVNSSLCLVWTVRDDRTQIWLFSLSFQNKLKIIGAGNWISLTPNMKFSSYIKTNGFGLHFSIWLARSPLQFSILPKWKKKKIHTRVIVDFIIHIFSHVYLNRRYKVYGT